MCYLFISSLSIPLQFLRTRDKSNRDDASVRRINNKTTATELVLYLDNNININNKHVESSSLLPKLVET